MRARRGYTDTERGACSARAHHRCTGLDCFFNSCIIIHWNIKNNAGVDNLVATKNDPAIKKTKQSHMRASLEEREPGRLRALGVEFDWGVKSMALLSNSGVKIIRTDY